MIEHLPRLENGKLYFRITKDEIVWFCSECDKQFQNPPPDQCSCGAPDKVFLEKKVKPKESDRKDYLVDGNFALEGFHIPAGSIVSMRKKDFMTKDLLNRELISIVSDKKEEVCEVK